MKKEFEKEILKIAMITMRKKMKNAQSRTAICPLIFYQPKRPKK